MAATILEVNGPFEAELTRKKDLKLSEEKLQESNERNFHLKCEIDSVVTDRIKIKQELNEKIQGLEKDKKSPANEVCDLKKEEYCIPDGDGFFSLPSKGDIERKYQFIVTTLMTAGRLVSLGIPKSHFTHVFIDEAGQGMEPECLVPIAGLLGTDASNLGQLVLAGDPKQLGPVLRSPVAIEARQQRAALETLSTQLQNVTDERDIDTVQLEMVADERDTVIEERDRVITQLEAVAEERDRVATQFNIATEERDRVTTQLEAVAEERDRVTTQLNTVTEEQDRVTTRLDTVIEERDRVTTRLEAVAEELDRVAAQLEAVTEERDRVTTELEAVAEERDSVTTQLEAVAEERVRVATQFNTLTEERDRVTTQLNTVTEGRDRVTAQLEAVTEDRDRVTTQLERTQTHNVALLDVINQFQERMQVFEAPGQDDQALHNELPEMLKLWKEKLPEAKERNMHLKCEIDSVVTDRIKIKPELEENKDLKHKNIWRDFEDEVEQYEGQQNVEKKRKFETVIFPSLLDVSVCWVYVEEMFCISKCCSQAVVGIEKHGDFNGGYGWRLNVNGEEERDAVIMEGHNMKSDRIRAVHHEKDPVRKGQKKQEHDSERFVTVNTTVKDLSCVVRLPRILDWVLVCCAPIVTKSFSIIVMTSSREVTPHITERRQSAQKILKKIQKFNKEIRGKDQELVELVRQSGKFPWISPEAIKCRICTASDAWSSGIWFSETAWVLHVHKGCRLFSTSNDNWKQQKILKDQQIDELKQQNHNLKQKLDELIQQNDNWKRQKILKDQQIDELKEQLNSMRNVVREKREEIAAKDGTIQELLAEKQALIQKIVDLEQKDSDELLRNNRVPSDITNMSLDISFDHESVECERCPEYCTKIVYLQEKLMKGEEKRQELEQENGTLKRQLDGSRETANLWKYVLVEEARDLRRKDKRDLEDKYKQEIAVLSDKIHSLENDNNSLNKKVCEQKREHEIVEQNILREGNAEKKTLQSKISALETENCSLAEKITESKNFIDNMLREEQEEKTAMVKIIHKLEEESRGKNEEIVELKEQVAQHRAALDAVKAQLETVTDERETARTQCNHLQTYNGALQNLVSQFRRRLQDLEDREDRLCAMVI